MVTYVDSLGGSSMILLGVDLASGGMVVRSDDGRITFVPEHQWSFVSMEGKGVFVCKPNGLSWTFRDSPIFAALAVEHNRRNLEAI